MIFTYNTWLVLAGAGLLGALCGAVGCFTVLQRRALLGDALAHAALPGVAIAFWITASKSLPILLLGALASGLLGVWFLAVLRKRTITKPDAAMALLLSVFFGAGIALSRYVQNTVTDGSQAGLDSFILGKTAGIIFADVALVGGVCLASLLVLIALFKEFRLVSFDPAFAAAAGFQPVFVDALLMALVAVAVVVGLPMVGVVMIAALTILPPVAARFWVKNLAWMVPLAAAFGIVSAWIGALFSASYAGLPTGPLVILCAGAVFVLSALFAPHRGLVAHVLRDKAARREHLARLGVTR